LNIPIGALEKAVVSEDVHSLVLSFFNRNGRAFGEKINLKVKVIPVQAELSEDVLTA